MKAITEFFLNAENKVYEAGFGKEIDYIDSLKFENQTAESFVSEYIYVVINSGIREQSARKIYNRVMKAMNDIREDWLLEVPNVPWKRNAIALVVADGKDWFEVVKASDDKIAVIRSFPGMGGDALGYHLARNLGLDFVKPDRHMKRLAARFGYETPLEMCQDIKDDFEKNIRLGTIDVILWRYCNLFGSDA